MKAMWFLEGGQVVCPETGINGRFDVLIDEGILSGKPSTVIDLTESEPKVLRA